jgi:hypothetical protein
MEGRAPKVSLKAEARKSEPGLFDIKLTNNGETDESLDLTVVVTWGNARMISADSLGSFSIFNPGRAGIGFQGHSVTSKDQPIVYKIRPGETIPVGWLRFDRDTEVMANVSQPGK